LFVAGSTARAKRPREELKAISRRKARTRRRVSEEGVVTKKRALEGHEEG